MARALARKAETSTTLLEAAKKVLRQNGYSGLSTRDVAAAAGVPLSQIHYHFGSKQGMVLALFEYLNAQLLDRQNALFGDPTLKLSRAMGPGLRLSRRRHRLGLRARPAGADRRELGRRRGRQGRPRRHHGMVRSHRRRSRARPSASSAASARSRRRRSAPSSASAFIGAESLYLLGLEKKGVAGAPGAAARRRSHPHCGSCVIEEVMSCVRSCPIKEGFVERDGVKLYYEVYGDGPQTMVFLPPWSIVHSRVYKAQLPYFSERFRCITYDGRGNGKSDRPADVAAYSLDNYVADALAVMDATDAGQAILVGLSFGGMLACVLAAHHPERVQGRDPGRHRRRRIGPGYPYMAPKHFLAKQRAVRGLGQVQSRATGWPTIPTSPSTSSATSSPSRTRPSRSRTASNGPSETTGAVLAKTVEARAIAAAVRCQRGDVSQDPLPAADDPRRQRPDPALCARAKLVAEAHRRRARDHPGRRAQSAWAAFPAKCNALIIDFLDRRLGIPAPEDGGAAGRARPRGRSISPRRSASGTAAATSPSRASCASFTRTCRSTGWRRTRSRACSRPAASASIR